MSDLIHIPPLQYMHVLDRNTNLVDLYVGPRTIMLKSNEELVAGPSPMIVVPPGHYCVINDPKKPGNTRELLIGQQDIRFHGDPFPLYPGEWHTDPAIKPLKVVRANCAIRLIALQDHMDDGTARVAGDTWQLQGPLTYKPRPEVMVKDIISPEIIKVGQVLKLKARQDTVDVFGNPRVTGEEWLVKEQGAYLPAVFEEVVSLENVLTLTADTALHLRATQSIIDLNGIKRQAGEEWLLTSESTSEYSTQVGVEVIKTVKKTVVKKGQYAVVFNPVDGNGKAQLGQRVLKVGLCSFFLHPGEFLENSKIDNARILSKEESIVLQCLDSFVDIVDGKSVMRTPGERWLIKGPINYIPPVHVEIIHQRKEIPLSKNEGIYIQNTQTGKVRLVLGPCAYMMTELEELWKKELSNEIEELLRHGGGIGTEDIRKVAYFEQSIDPSIVKGRDKTKVVTYRCPSNTAVQVYDYQQKSSRIVFGPDLVVLGPCETFNVLSLSGGKPKKEHALKSLCLMLGPDFMTDIIEVETSDHARLRLRIAFNNHFEVDKTDPKSTVKIFSVPDFIGFACRQIGSRIRSSVALTTFDQFHRYSAQIIQSAVFGKEKVLKFDVNSLIISSIDIQSIEPVDAKMRNSLNKSVQLAIEISTNSIEAAATHEAKRAEQVAKGHLERQVLSTEKESEKKRTELYELRALTSAIQSTGQAKAEAQAQAERSLIECQSQIEATKLKSLAAGITDEANLTSLIKSRSCDLDYQKRQNNIAIEKEKAFAHLEVNKFQEMVRSLGTETITAIASAGQETQLKLLKSLGLDSVLFTDGNSPINLLTTAAGLVGGTSNNEQATA